MNGYQQQTLGALLVRLEARERQIAAEAEAAHEEIAQLTALLAGLAQEADHITITRKTLLGLPDEIPSMTASRTGRAGGLCLPAEPGCLRRRGHSAAGAGRLRGDGP